jgi:hypothetical protein
VTMSKYFPISSAIAMALVIAWSTSGCATLPAVVQDVASIAQIVIADVEKGESAEAIISDVEAQDGAATLALIVSIVDSLLGDAAVKAADVPGLQAVAAKASAQIATGAAR